MTAPEAVASKPPSVWEDFLDIFYAPSQVFARRENGSFGLQLVVVTIATVALYLATRGVMSPIYDAMAAKQMEEVMRQNPQLTQEQLEQGRGMANIFGIIAVAIGTPIAMLVLGVVVWLVGKLFDSQATLRSAFIIAVMAYVPRLLEWVLNAVQAALMDPSSLTSLATISLGPARFLDPAETPALVMTLALRLGLFILWSTVLIAIGLKVMGKIPIAKAAAAAFIVWLLGAVPAYFQAAQM